MRLPSGLNAARMTGLLWPSQLGDHLAGGWRPTRWRVLSREAVTTRLSVRAPRGVFEHAGVPGELHLLRSRRRIPDARAAVARSVTMRAAVGAERALRTASSWPLSFDENGCRSWHPTLGGVVAGGRHDLGPVGAPSGVGQVARVALEDEARLRSVGRGTVPADSLVQRMC